MKITLRSLALLTLLLGPAVFATAGDDAATGTVGEKASPETTTSRIKFSDPSKPGTLKAQLPWADVHVIGTDAADITVTSSLSEKGKEESRTDGLRRLDSDLAFELTEKGNVATLQLAGDSGMAAQGSEFTIQLPRQTALVLRTEMGGDVVVENIDGDIEVNSMNGEITLRDIGSSAVVNTMNGEINAAFRRAPSKPVSLTSMNGEISLKLPADTKANLRMRSHNGSLLTDFSAAVLKTKSEPAPAHNGQGEMERAQREIEKAQVEIEKAQREQEKAGNAFPQAPMPPLPPLPAFGGKAITGALNGGGVEISLSTMNGSITVRQADGKAAPAPAAGSKSE